MSGGRCTQVDQKPLPPRDPKNVITDKEFANTIHVATMKKNKVTGPDKIPIEVFKSSQNAREMLKKLITKMWTDEEVPIAFGRAVFIMLYKNKVSSNDPGKYRCIGLLNHAYKVLSTIILGRITAETQDYLQDWQAGFRQRRGCRDNILITKNTGRTSNGERM